MTQRIAFVVLPAILATVLPAQEGEKPSPTFELTADEVAAGWHVLFDGTGIDAWKGYRRDAFPDKGWAVKDGALVVQKGGGGDIVTRRRYRDFELALEWKVTPGANSGIMYRVAEADGASYKTGPEYQILDDAGHRDGGNPATSAGSLYALYAPLADKKMKAVGEWNTGRIVIRGNSVEHWLNGVQVASAVFGSDDWKARIAKSKFANWEQFAKIKRGHICLQDHGDEVHYRNIKIRELTPMADRLGKPVTLFDGSGMDAWSAFLRRNGKMDDVWSITDDGVLVCMGKPAGYIYTVDKFQDYVIKVQWRFSPVTKKAGNSGVLLRITGEHKVWPRSIEAQLQSRNAGDFWNIGKYPMQTDASRTKGRNTKKTHGNENPIGEWNEYEIIVDDGWVQLRVNGEVLNEAWDCEVIPGHIGLQSEGAEIHFKRVLLYPLKQ